MATEAHAIYHILCPELISTRPYVQKCGFEPYAVRNGHIKRITDQDIQSSVLEVMSANVSTTYITCPADPQQTLGIKLPFLVMIIKNLKKYFSFEVQVLDDKNVRRRFRASNYQVRCGAATKHDCTPLLLATALAKIHLLGSGA